MAPMCLATGISNMGVAYYRRFRMEIDLQNASLAEATLPEGFRFLAWDPDDLDRHAEVKVQSFRDEIDSQVFPCLGGFSGCRKLMREISRQRSFRPETTWLIAGPDGDVGTIQGLAHSRTLGAIQNVGVVPECRGQGLGRSLVIKSLAGFRLAGLKRVYLEVTAENQPAVALYDSLGFRLVRTMYKAVKVETARV